MIDLSKLKNDDMNFTHRLIEVMGCWNLAKGLDDFLTYHMKRENNNISSDYLVMIFYDLDVQ